MAFTLGAAVQYYLAPADLALASFAPGPCTAYVVGINADATAQVAVIPPNATYIVPKSKIVQGTGPGQAQ